MYVECTLESTTRLSLNHITILSFWFSLEILCAASCSGAASAHRFSFFPSSYLSSVGVLLSIIIASHCVVCSLKLCQSERKKPASTPPGRANLCDVSFCRWPDSSFYRSALHHTPAPQPLTDSHSSRQATYYRASVSYYRWSSVPRATSFITNMPIRK